MTTVELVPNADVSFGADWTAVGAATVAAALGDLLSASYITATLGPATTAITGGWAVDMTTATLAANQAIAGIRLRISVLQAAMVAPAVSYRVAAVAGPNATARLLATPDCANPPIDPTNACFEAADAPGIWYSAWWSTNSGAQWTQADLDGLRVQGSIVSPVPSAAPAVWQIATAVVEVDVRSKPTVTVNPSLGTDVGALVTWVTFDADGDPQNLWEMAVFTAAQAAIGGFDPSTAAATYRVTGTGSAKSAVVAATLTVGTQYVTYVRVGKLIGIDDNGFRLTPPVQFPLMSDWAPSTLLVSEVLTSNYVPQLPDEAELGCHDWAALIAPRGGGQTLVELPWRQIQWGRKLQEVSTSSVTVARSECSADWWPTISKWEHELQVWRDSAWGDVNEWVGAYTGRSRPDRESVQFRARDWWTIFEHRRLHADYSLAGIELATIYAAFAIDALAVDQSSGIQLLIRQTGVPGDRSVSSAQRRRSADLLRDLGRNGVDWTMVGRDLLAGGVELPVDALTVLLDEHVQSVRVEEISETAATDVAVVGKLVDTTQILGSASLADDPRGVLETTVNASDIEDNESANAYALATLALLAADPASYTMTLEADAQVSMTKLIPGARWAVNLPSVDLIQTLRLDSVDVSINRGEDGISETVTVVLTSLGSEAL